MDFTTDLPNTLAAILKMQLENKSLLLFILKHLDFEMDEDSQQQISQILQHQIDEIYTDYGKLPDEIIELLNRKSGN